MHPLAELIGWPPGKATLARLRHRYRTRKAVRRDMATGAWVMGGTLVVALTVLFTHGPDGPLNWTSDWLIATFSKTAPRQHPKVALVYVTNNTIKDLPYIAPLDRAMLANLLTTVARGHPKAIGLDFILDRATDKVKDDALKATIKAMEVPVVAGVLDQRSPPGTVDIVAQEQFLADARPRRRGHIYFDENPGRYSRSDHVVRAIAKPAQADKYQESLAEAMVAATAEGPPEMPTRTISWLLPPHNNADTFLTLPAERILDVGSPLKDLLAGKYVIIGGNFPDRDQHYTPLSDSVEYPGPFIHAQALAQILEQRKLYSPIPWQQAATGACFFVFGFWLGRRDIAERAHRAIETTAVISLIVVAIVSFSVFDLLFPVTAIFIGGSLGLAAGHYSVR